MFAPPQCNEFKGKSEWGGYSWNKTLFPDPAAFVQKMHAVGSNANGKSAFTLGTKVAVNYHPDSGIDACQDQYEAMAKALGFDTSSKNKIPDEPCTQPR